MVVVVVVVGGGGVNFLNDHFMRHQKPFQIALSCNDGV